MSARGQDQVASKTAMSAFSKTCRVAPPKIICLPAKTVPEFIAFAKANPGKISYTSGGVGTPLHMAGEMFEMMTDTNMTHVPYRGVAPALVDLLGGQVQVVFGGVSPAIEHIRTRKLRALAMTTTTRLELLPDIPSMADFVPGYEASQWFAAGLRKNTPVEITDKLNKEINASIALGVRRVLKISFDVQNDEMRRT